MKTLKRTHITQSRAGSGLSDEAIERITNGTAPLLFDRDVDLMPVVADFDEYLEDMNAQEKDRREKTWRFF